MINVDQRLRWQNEQVRQLRHKSIHLPRLLTVTALMSFGLFVAALALVFVSRSVDTPVNPFAVYADILPGQLWSNMEAHGFECDSYNAGNTYIETCSLRPTSGIFSRVSVEPDGDTIGALMFSIRQNTLTLGDVALAFGIRLVGQPSRNSWMGGDYSASVWMDMGQFSYFQPVHHLYLYRSEPDQVVGSLPSDSV
ncbi:MAG TPA: hypothetical protein VK003_13280 [Oceanobacillus sp.]|nr:hypothetical protein [Oceanobacillus sp.]